MIGKAQGGSRTRPVVCAVAVLALLLFTSASASAVSILFAGAGSHEVLVPPGQNAIVNVRAPFMTNADGSVYAKLLPTPWNPVIRAASDDVASGWWVELGFANVSGSAPVPLGRYADDRPTPRVPVLGNVTHELVVRLHVPASASRLDARYSIPFSVALDRSAANVANASGAAQDPSSAFTLHVRVSADAAAALAFPGTRGGPVAELEPASLDAQPPWDATDVAGPISWTEAGSSRASAAPEGAGSGSSVTLLLVGIVLLMVLVLHWETRREVRALRRDLRTRAQVDEESAHAALESWLMSVGDAPAGTGTGEED